jgi:hypothetical protein
VPVGPDRVDALLDAVGPGVGERHHVRERLLRHDLLERRLHRGHRQAVARERAADATHVDVLELDGAGDAVGDVLAEAEGPARDAATDGPGPAQMVCVSSLTSSAP